MTFKRGDIVHHVTNPKQFLFIEEFGDGFFSCKWISSTGVYHHEYFSEDQLVLADPLGILDKKPHPKIVRARKKSRPFKIKKEKLIKKIWKSIWKK